MRNVSEQSFTVVESGEQGAHERAESLRWKHEKRWPGLRVWLTDKAWRVNAAFDRWVDRQGFK